MLTAAVIGLLVSALILFGIAYDTSADSPHPKPIAWAIHMTMIHSVKWRAATGGPPPTMDRARLLAGAKVYEARCIECHGGPGVARAPWVSAMLPTPPFLLDARVRWRHHELEHIVRHGVKMTAMPAWGELLSDRQITDVVAFVEAVPMLAPGDFARLRESVRAQPAN
ncbi:c-type cytochrome [Sphingomonas sp. Root710]|uniref:c-type cytochrome n=1 Tax=Sphingomonas sp. Root710 TaxID=1736594 RepID=UPI001F3C5B1C|nr:cytochrome c [Sphingomonas sp. Root710]